MNSNTWDFPELGEQVIKFKKKIKNKEVPLFSF